MTKFKKIAALIMTVVMALTVLTVTSSAAVLTQSKSITVKNPYSSMTVKAHSKDTLADRYASVASTSSSKLLKVGLTFTYDQDSVVDENDWYCGRIFPITVDSAGTLLIDSKATVFRKDVDMGIYYDSDCETYLDSYMDAPTTSGTTAKDSVQLPAAGTYYLKVSSYNYDSTFTNTVVLDLSFFTAKGMSLKSDITYYLGTNDTDKYYKITVPSTKVVTFTGSDSMYYELCNSKKNLIYDYQSLDERYSYKASYRLAKGTYYVKVTSAYPDYDYLSFKYTLSSDATLKNKTYKTFYPGDSDCVNYFKFKATKTGYVTVVMRDANNYATSSYITLCSSKKKALTDKVWVYTQSSTYTKAVFAVEKNTTYYLKVTDVDGKAAIKYTQTSISEKSGSTLKKAKSLSKSKTVKGTISAGSSRADYYKIKLTKSQKLKLYVAGDAAGSLDIQVYTAKGAKYGYAETAVYGVNDEDVLTSYKKLSKGTYYIKIYRNDSKSNGYYTLKWK